MGSERSLWLNNQQQREALERTEHAVRTACEQLASHPEADKAIQTAMLYGFPHCAAVEETLYECWPEPPPRLSPDDRLTLVLACYLHTLPFLTKEPAALIRDVTRDYDARLSKCLDNLKAELRLSASVMAACVDCCAIAHAAATLSEKIAERPPSHRLAAMLLWALSIHHHDWPRNEVFLHAPSTEQEHFMRMHFVRSVSRDQDRLLMRLVRHGADPRMHQRLEQFLRDHLNVVAHATAPTLNTAGINLPHVQIIIEERPSNDVRPAAERALRMTMLARTGSSTELADSIIEDLNSACTTANSSSELSAQRLKEYNDDLIKTVVENRPCHVMLRGLQQMVEKALTSTSDVEFDSAGALTDLSRQLDTFRNLRQLHRARLRANAQGLLIDGGGVLLFGHSALVLDALAAALKQGQRWETEQKTLNVAPDGRGVSQTPLYVCMCSCKTDFDEAHKVRYADGVEYADKLVAAGFENVFLLPDMSAATLVDSGAITKVLFGANGVQLLPTRSDPSSSLLPDTRRDGDRIAVGLRFGHTAGHLSLSVIASAYRIPVYVVADRWKFGSLHSSGHQTDRRERWLPPSEYKRMKTRKVQVLNPREDVLEVFPSSGGDLYFIVTDLGVFPTTAVPQRAFQILEKPWETWV